jgi:hypothetical protein
MNGGQGRHLAARGLHGRGLSVLVSMRPAYLAVLRVLGWLALLARGDRPPAGTITGPPGRPEPARAPHPAAASASRARLAPPAAATWQVAGPVSDLSVPLAGMPPVADPANIYADAGPGMRRGQAARTSRGRAQVAAHERGQPREVLIADRVAGPAAARARRSCRRCSPARCSSGPGPGRRGARCGGYSSRRTVSGERRAARMAARAAMTRPRTASAATTPR